MPVPLMPDVYKLALLRWNPDEVQSCLEETEELFFCFLFFVLIYKSGVIFFFLEERQNSCLDPEGTAWARVLSVGWPQEDQRRWPQHFLCCSTSDCSPIFPTARVSSSLKCQLNGHGFLLILYSELNPDLPAPVRALTQTLSASPLNVVGLRSFHLNLRWVLSTISASSISVGM